MTKRNQRGQFNTDGLEEKVVLIRRTSKKTKGGNKIGFSVLMVVGDKKGKVGVGLGKATTVIGAIRKSSSFAKRRMVETVLKYGRTIPFKIEIKYGAGRVLLKPAPAGVGVVAGAPVRAVLEAAGYRDVVSKILGTNNKITNVYTTMKGLELLRKRTERLSRLRRPTTKKRKQLSEEAEKSKG